MILNGDVFDDLFEGPGECERAHPEVLEEIRQLSVLGRLRRTQGNHDPDQGEEQVVLEWPGTGRVLVAHGHAADPLNRSVLGRLGDGISRRFGRMALVRNAARLAETLARAAAGQQMEELFRRRCLQLVEREACDLGVFGHVHAPHLSARDRYANSGSLTDQALEYLELGPGGPRLCTLTAEGLAAKGREGT